MVHVLIYGKNSWIGSFFALALQERNAYFEYSQIRVGDIKILREELDKINPTHVVLCLGKTYSKDQANIDYLQNNLEINLESNFMVHLSVITECVNRNIHITYVGTGCIYSYFDKIDDYKPFTETSEANFFGSDYSLVKGKLDRHLRNFYEDKILNLRFRMPISFQEHPRELLTKLKNYEKISLPPNSVSVLDELIPVAVDMLLSQTVGTFNMVNSGSFSDQEYIKLYKEYIDPEFTKEIVYQRDLNLRAKRSNALLDNSKLLEKYYISDIKDKIIEIFQERIKWKNSTGNFTGMRILNSKSEHQEKP